MNAPAPQFLIPPPAGRADRDGDRFGVVHVGGALARVARAAMLTAAEQIKLGSFDGLAGGSPGGALNGVFGGFD